MRASHQYQSLPLGLQRYSAPMPLLLAVVIAVSAMDPPYNPPFDPNATITDIHDGLSFGLWAAGAVSGFAFHESGHLLANWAFHNVPQWVSVNGFGFIPFFAISPQIYCSNGTCQHFNGTPFAGGPPGMYTISSAGFDMQHLSSEAMLTYNPNLRYTVAPYQKGWLAFNVFVSLGYAIVSWADKENGYGDVGGSANAAGLSHNLYGALILIPAALDAYRYFKPDSVWAPWVSRGSKLAVIGVAFTL